MVKNLKCYYPVLAIIIAVCLVFIISTPVFAEDEIEKAKRNLVCVVVKNATGDVLGWSAGFVIGVEEPYEYVITNWRTVNPEKYELNRVEVFILVPPDDMVPARVFHQLEDSDIAILKLDPEHLLYGFVPLELGSRDLAETGEAVYALGFPDIDPDPDNDNDDNDNDQFRASHFLNKVSLKGILTEITTWGEVDVYKTNAAVGSGNSGGPLINEKGQVLGINSHAMLEEAEINGAVQVDYLVDFLDRRNIPFVSADDAVFEDNNDEEEEETDILLIVGIGAGSLVLVAIILIMVMGGRKRRKPPVKKPAVPKDVAVPQAPKQPAESPPAPWDRTKAVPGLKDRRKEEAPGIQPGKKETKPFLKGIAGSFAGKTTEFFEGQIVIGRDPRLAQLIYPQNNTDISRKHCTIRFDEKTYKFILEDHSSNGTFLSSNQRLEAGKQYYINAGDRFYLAKPMEVFEVNLEIK